MRKICLAGIVGLLIFIGNVYGQEDVNPLEFKIKAAKEIYTVGDEIDLTLTLKNNGKTPVKVYDLDYPAVVEIKVVDAESALITPKKKGASPGTPVGLITISPGETKIYQRPHLRWFDANTTWEFNEKEQFPSHNYTIVATMTNPPSGIPVDKAPADRWQGTLSSNLLKIKIFEPSMHTMKGAYPIKKQKINEDLKK